MTNNTERITPPIQGLTILYDSSCPLCCAEMAHLKRKDVNNLITLVDIHQSDFSTLYPNIEVEQAMKILHGLYDTEILLGLAVTHRAWTLVGNGFWVAPLNWPLIKPLSHQIYLWVAKHRQSISTFLAKTFGINKPYCNKGTCYDDRTNANSRGK